jgi:hypothetical protein
MPTYSTTTKYLLRALLGGNLVSDIDTGFASLASDIDANMAGYAEGTFAGKPAAAKAGRIYRCTDTGQWLADTGTAWIDLNAAPQLLSSLPSSPYDGQEIYYSADPTNGVIWHLRYRSASAPPYKWELVGGPPLTARPPARPPRVTSARASPSSAVRRSTVPSVFGLLTTAGAKWGLSFNAQVESGADAVPRLHRRRRRAHQGRPTDRPVLAVQLR